jgi:cob(I)alamin adenosyltransferase
MSEERLSRIENILAAIQAQMATKQELQALRAEMATKKELQALRAEVTTLGADMATLRAQVATKADLEAALSGVATNVEITLLGRQLRELMSMKDDIAVVSAMAQRLDNTMVRLINDVLTEVRAEHSRMDRLLSRVRALEEAQPHGG